MPIKCLVILSTQRMTQRILFISIFTATVVLFPIILINFYSHGKTFHSKAIIRMNSESETN